MSGLPRLYDRCLQFRVDDRNGGFAFPPELDVVGELAVR
jgi:hypothetical protein